MNAVRKCMKDFLNEIFMVGRTRYNTMYSVFGDVIEYQLDTGAYFTLVLRVNSCLLEALWKKYTTYGQIIMKCSVHVAQDTSKNWWYLARSATLFRVWPDSFTPQSRHSADLWSHNFSCLSYNNTQDFKPVISYSTMLDSWQTITYLLKSIFSINIYRVHQHQRVANLAVV